MDKRSVMEEYRKKISKMKIDELAGEWEKNRLIFKRKVENEK